MEGRILQCYKLGLLGHIRADCLPQVEKAKVKEGAKVVGVSLLVKFEEKEIEAAP